jgi:hypothetical protein
VPPGARQVFRCMLAARQPGGRARFQGRQRRTFPIASRPLSKKKSTPNKMNRKPRPVRPTPISARPMGNTAQVPRRQAAPLK